MKFSWAMILVAVVALMGDATWGQNASSTDKNLTNEQLVSYISGQVNLTNTSLLEQVNLAAPKEFIEIWCTNTSAIPCPPGKDFDECIAVEFWRNWIVVNGSGGPLRLDLLTTLVKRLECRDSKIVVKPEKPATIAVVPSSTPAPGSTTPSTLAPNSTTPAVPAEGPKSPEGNDTTISTTTSPTTPKPDDLKNEPQAGSGLVHLSWILPLVIIALCVVGFLIFRYMKRSGYQRSSSFMAKNARNGNSGRAASGGDATGQA